MFDRNAEFRQGWLPDLTRGLTGRQINLPGKSPIATIRIVKAPSVAGCRIAKSKVFELAYSATSDVQAHLKLSEQLMKSTAKLGGLVAGALLALAICANPASAAILVYDIDVDFSDTNNPNATWTYQQGNSLLTHYTPVPQPKLTLGVANGYWGTSSSSLSTSVMKATADGSATGLYSDNDFKAGDVLVRTTDPSAGGPVRVTWTAPSNGTYTYGGWVWFAGAPEGPGGNSFSLTFNAGPVLESGVAGFGQNRPNAVSMLNGLLPMPISAGDVLTLEFNPLPGPPSGSLAGVAFTVDFTPVPEPGTLALAATGVAALALLRRHFSQVSARPDKSDVAI